MITIREGTVQSDYIWVGKCTRCGAIRAYEKEEVRVAENCYTTRPCQTPDCSAVVRYDPVKL